MPDDPVIQDFSHAPAPGGGFPAIIGDPTEEFPQDPSFLQYPPPIMEQSGTLVQASNTTSDVVLCAITIPQGQPQAGDIYRLRAWGSQLNDTGAAVGYTHKIRFGGLIPLQSASVSYGASAIDRNWILSVDLFIKTTSVQQYGAFLSSGATGSANTLEPFGSSESLVGVGAGSVNTNNANRLLEYLIQMNTASVNATYSLHGFYLEYLTNQRSHVI